MDDDSPDDVALRTLTQRAVRRPRPRPRHRRRARHGAHASPPTTCAAFFAAHYTSEAATVVGRRRRRPRRHRGQGGRGVRRPPGRRRSHRPHRPGRVGHERRTSTTTPSRCTSRSGARRCGATTPTARRSTSSTTCSAAVCRAGCSTRSASVAASPTASTRPRRPTPTPVPGRCTPGRCPSTPARCIASCSPSSTGSSAGGITDDELAIAVGYLTGAYEMGLEDTGARMSRLGGMLATLGKVHTRRGAAGALGARSPSTTCNRVIGRSTARPSRSSLRRAGVLVVTGPTRTGSRLFAAERVRGAVANEFGPIRRLGRLCHLTGGKLSPDRVRGWRS